MTPRWPFAPIFVGALAVVMIGGATVAALVAGDRPPAGGWGLVIGLTVAFSATALVVLVMVLAFGAYNRARVRHVRSLRPEAEVFTATRVDGFEQGLVGLTPSNGGIGTAFAVSIGARGVELWRNASLDAPAYAIDASDIAAISTDSAVIRNRQGATVAVPALLVTRRSGGVLPLTVATEGSGFPASAATVAALAHRLQARIPAA